MVKTNPARSTTRLSRVGYSKKEMEGAHKRVKQIDRVNAGALKKKSLSATQKRILEAKLARINKRMAALLKKENINPKDVIFVGVDRGGRIPTLLLRKALGIKDVQFLRLGRGEVSPFFHYILNMAKKGKWKGKVVLFVDSTAKTGHQRQQIKDFFNSRAGKSIGVKGWRLVAEGPKADWKIKWGFGGKKDTGWHFFEDLDTVLGTTPAMLAESKLKVVKTKGKTPKEVRQSRKILLKRA